MVKSILIKILEKLLNYSRFEQQGKVKISGLVKGINQVDFEGNNAVLGNCNFNGVIKVGYATTFSTHNLIHGDVQIGKYCQFAPYASINTFNHPTNHITTYINKRLLNGYMTQYKTCAKTVVGNDVWIGKNAIILGGITVGDGAIIAAGSVVTKNVLAYHVVAGVPAKVIKKRFSDTMIHELIQLKWWDKTEEEIQEIKYLFDKDLTKLDSIYE